MSRSTRCRSRSRRVRPCYSPATVPFPDQGERDMAIRTGSVYRRKDGIWCAVVQVHGKRRTLYARTEQGARRNLSELQHQFAVTGRLPDAGWRTVSDLVTAWLRSATIKRRTRADRENLNRRYIASELGDVRLTHLDATHLQRLYVALQERGLKRVPAGVHAVVHRALAIAVRWVGYRRIQRTEPSRHTTAHREGTCGASTAFANPSTELARARGARCGRCWPRRERVLAKRWP
jgi:hypothetical protein